MCLDFGLLVRQNKQFKDITLGTWAVILLGNFFQQISGTRWAKRSID